MGQTHRRAFLNNPELSPEFLMENVSSSPNYIRVIYCSINQATNAEKYHAAISTVHVYKWMQETLTL